MVSLWVDMCGDWSEHAEEEAEEGDDGEMAIW
jgi:hypothetical protein